MQYIYQDNLRLKLGSVIKYLGRAFTHCLDEDFLREYGIRSTQYTILREIKTNNTFSLTEMSEQLGMERSTLSRTMIILEKSGFICRTGDSSDKRNTTYSLTATGNDAATRGLSHWAATHLYFEDLAKKHKINLKKAEIGLNELIKLAMAIREDADSKINN